MAAAIECSKCLLHLMSFKPSKLSMARWAFANPPTPLTAYAFADSPPPLIGEEKLLLGIKIAVAIVGFMIFIVILIRKLRECDSSSSGSSASEGGGVINGQVRIQLPTLINDDGSVMASAA